MPPRLSASRLCIPDPDPVPCPTLYAELPQVSASITVNLPCQPGVPGPGQRLPHAIREDLAPEEPEWALTNPRWDPAAAAAAAAPPRPPPPPPPLHLSTSPPPPHHHHLSTTSPPPPLHGACTSGQGCQIGSDFRQP